MNPKELYQSSLELVKTLITFICRQHSLFGEEAEDFSSWVHLRLIDKDYGVFRKFAGNSSMKTYLNTVILRLALDYRDKHWGRWRPSSQAQVLGETAKQLEALVYRDGHPFPVAVDMLRTNRALALNEAELAKLFTQLPIRHAVRLVGEENLVHFPASEPTQDQRMIDRETNQDKERTHSLLGQAMEQLDTEERFIIRMRFEENISVAHIARTLGLDQKKLYRRIEKILNRLRHVLADKGVKKIDIAVMFR